MNRLKQSDSACTVCVCFEDDKEAFIRSRNPTSPLEGNRCRLGGGGGFVVGVKLSCYARPLLMLSSHQHSHRPPPPLCLPS